MPEIVLTEEQVRKSWLKQRLRSSFATRVGP